MNVQLQLNLLGTPEIKRGGTPVTGFVLRKSVALLCYLAVTGQTHSRELLAGLFWGDATETNARAGLRKTLAELRRLVGPHLLITRHEVAFNRDANYFLDVEPFTQAVLAFRQDQIPSLSPARVVELTESVALYRGEFLAGFHIHRAPVFEEWVLLQRERLRLGALRMLYALAIHHLTQAAYAQAITYTERLLLLEPCHEEAHRLLMSLLALSGQPTAAMRQYQIYCQTLAEDIGLEPNEETTALYERIRDAQFSEANDTAVHPQLAHPSMPLIGRRKELDDILTSVRDPRCRLLTLLGPGGSGKTHLAKAIAAAVLAQAEIDGNQPDRVYLISLGSLPSIESLTATLAHGVGFYFSQESHPRQQVLSFLRRQRALLILDGCEGLLDQYDPEQGGFIDLVNDILDFTPEITILATSRTRLNLPSEFLYPLAGMTYPLSMPDDPEDLFAYDAVQLFLWRMRSIRPELEPSAKDMIAIAKLCRQTAGLPLGLLLLANWVRLLTPEAIAAQIIDRPARRYQAPTHRAPLHAGISSNTLSLQREPLRSLTPVFDHSWHLLSADEQRTLATLTVFQGGFTYQAAHEISGISIRSLTALHDQSVLNRLALSYQPRFEIHDLFREYVEVKSDMTSVLSKAHAQHSIYYMARLSEWAESLQGAGEQKTLEKLDIEIANCRAAWDWAICGGRSELLDQGMDGLCRFYQRRHRLSEGESACHAAVGALSTASQPDQRVLGKALAWQSLFTRKQETALVLLKDSLEILDELAAAGEDVRAERATALLWKGCRLQYADHVLSKDILRESLALFRQLGDDWHAAYVLGRLHIQSWNSGAYEQGRQIAGECLALYHKIGYLGGYAGILGDRGIGELQAGLIEEGMQSIQESIDIFKKLGDRAGIVKGLYFRSMALSFAGQWQEADTHLQSCLSIGIENCPFIESILINRAIVKTHLGQYAQAREYAQIGLERATEIENQMCIGRALMALALAALSEDELEGAERLGQQAVSVYRSFGQKTELGMALAAEGIAMCQKGDLTSAQALLHEALSLAVTHHDQMSLIYALAGVAVLQSHVGFTMPAIETYTLIARFPLVSDSQWFRDVIKSRIDSAAAFLPPLLSLLQKTGVEPRTWKRP